MVAAIERELRCAAAVGEDAEVADAVQPFRQDVKQEAPDELVDGDGGGLGDAKPGAVGGDKGGTVSEVGRRQDQALDLEEVGALCALGQIGDAHLLDHALAKRAAPRRAAAFPVIIDLLDHDGAPPDRSGNGPSKGSMLNRDRRKTGAISLAYPPAKTQGVSKKNANFRRPTTRSAFVQWQISHFGL